MLSSHLFNTGFISLKSSCFSLNPLNFEKTAESQFLHVAGTGSISKANALSRFPQNWISLSIKIGFHYLSKLQFCKDLKLVTSSTTAKLERSAVQRIGLEQNNPFSQMGFGTWVLHLISSNLSGKLLLHQSYLCFFCITTLLLKNP